MPKYAFKFISGKYQGGEYPLIDEGELTIGRAADVEIVLLEDMVSRRHAKLVAHAGKLTLSDLGSTNGTFVNGEKVKTAVLNKDDRVLVGTSILKLIMAADAALAHEPEDKDALRAMLVGLGDRGGHSSQNMSGDLAEVPLPDLLQLFSTNRKTGLLRLTCSDAHYGEAELFLAGGKLQHVQAQGLSHMPPQKILSRLVAVNTGAFEFSAQALPPGVPETLTQSTENLLIEATRLNDETARARKSLPPCSHGFKLTLPLSTRLGDLNSEQLDVLQLAINGESVEEVLDHTHGTDQAAIEHLSLLLKANYLSLKR